LQHNLLLSHCSNVTIKGCRLDGSPYSSGLVLNACANVTVTNCEIARNAHYGVLISECTSVSMADCLIEGNDRSGVMIEYLHRGSADVLLRDNLIQYNNGYGLESYGATRLRSERNTLVGNRRQAQQRLSPDKTVLTNAAR
jgi:polygalacturonase